MGSLSPAEPETIGQGNMARAAPPRLIGEAPHHRATRGEKSAYFHDFESVTETWSHCDGISLSNRLFMLEKGQVLWDLNTRMLQ